MDFDVTKYLEKIERICDKYYTEKKGVCTARQCPLRINGNKCFRDTLDSTLSSLQQYVDSNRLQTRKETFDGLVKGTEFETEFSSRGVGGTEAYLVSEHPMNWWEEEA